MTAEARRKLSNAKARAWRKKHKAQEAARARRYAAERYGEAATCTRMFCHNKTRHESGLCWRHRAQRNGGLCA